MFSIGSNSMFLRKKGRNSTFDSKNMKSNDMARSKKQLLISYANFRLHS